MTSERLMGAIIVALIPLLIVAPVLFWFRRRRRDEVFVGVTPGERPALGQRAVRARVRGRRGEWSGPVAVRFTPPDGMTPGLVGVVVDGVAHVVDVSATLIDLAVRGHVHLHAEPVDPSTPPPPPRPDLVPGTEPPRTPPHDWRLTRISPAPPGPLLAFERELLGAVFADGPDTTLGELKRRGFDLTMRQAQIGLYREVVDRGWYARHPRDRNRRLGCLGIPLLLLGLAGLLAGLVAEDSVDDRLPMLIIGGGLVFPALLLLWGGRGRTPRTAEGSAARIQALGFREYLTKAEAGQIRFEEARDLFSAYLPYAMVFGVADRWAQVFADVARRARLADIPDVFFDLSWIDGFQLLHLAGDVAGALGDGLDVVDSLGSVVEGAGDFVSSTGGLLDFGDGCGGCSGCDL